MGAGAKSEAIRLIGAAITILDGEDAEPTDDDLYADTDTDEEDGPSRYEAAVARIDRLLDHGISRRVDHRVRQHKLDNNRWADFEASAAAEAIADRPGMAVLLGSHPSGYVRQEAVRLAHETIAAATKPESEVKVFPGLSRMLSQRSLDAISQVQEPAVAAVASLFEAEAAADNTGRMPTFVERACRELIATTRCVIDCPELVLAALGLFDSRVGRYSNNGVRDHHRHNLKEVDRRAQLLSELERLRPTLDAHTSQQAADRLVAFYEASMRPTTAV